MSTALTALQKKQHKITDTDFAVNETLTVRELNVEEISAEITAESSEDNYHDSDHMTINHEISESQDLNIMRSCLQSNFKLTSVFKSAA